MRTTLTLEDDVSAKLKAEVRRSGRSFKVTLNELLRFALAMRRGPKPGGDFRVRPRSMGLQPGLSLDCVGELLERLDGPAHK